MAMNQVRVRTLRERLANLKLNIEKCKIMDNIKNTFNNIPYVILVLLFYYIVFSNIKISL